MFIYIKQIKILSANIVVVQAMKRRRNQVVPSSSASNNNVKQPTSSDIVRQTMLIQSMMEHNKQQATNNTEFIVNIVETEVIQDVNMKAVIIQYVLNKHPVQQPHFYASILTAIENTKNKMPGAKQVGYDNLKSIVMAAQAKAISFQAMKNKNKNKKSS
jgi:hypothetical protein